MSMFTYNRDIPDAPNNPSNDQPKMQVNTNSTQDLIAVDHVSFNLSPGGTHKQATFSSKNAAGAQVDPQSVLYTGDGTASTVANLLFRNQNAIFPINTVRAWGFVNGATGAVVNNQSVNVASVVRNSAGNYTVTLTANAVTTADFAILVSSTSNTSAPTRLVYSSYAITGIGTFTLKFDQLANGTGQDVTSFSFQVLQI